MQMIDIKIENHICLLTLNRPEAANALSIQMLNELNQALDTIANDANVFCTVIIGSGEKAFCAGADLKERKGMSDEDVIKTVKSIGRTVDKVDNLPMPVIAALNGVAFGGGLELALACDLRIASKEVKLGLTETSLAIIPGAGGTQRLPRLIGLGQAKKLIYTAQRLNAESALELGIVEEVVAQSELLDAAITLAQQIASNGPIAVQAAKKAINDGMQTDLVSGLEIEHQNYQLTIPTIDRKEGLLAFQEKRKPEYKGE